MSERQNREQDRERIRLLEFQLDHLRAELLHLTHERYRLIYSVSGHIYRFLRPIEAFFADAANALGGRFRPAPPDATTPVASDQGAPPARGAPLPARRLLVDVTGTIKRDAGTGIQRVVKEVTRGLSSGESFDLPAVAVRCEGGRLLTANGFVAELVGGDIAPDSEIAIAGGDRFLMLSDSWNAFDELAPIFAKIRDEGGEVVTCIFDLIPELYPHACHEVTVPRYRAWLRKALLESDSFLAISQTVADELADYVAAQELPHRPGLKIGWFHCGSDLALRPDAAPRDKVKAAVAGDAPVFLAVGTIEPRKGQRVALRAFEELWARGRDVRIAFVGRRGWFEEAVVREILGHKEFGRRLFWFDDSDDDELSFLYDHAAALIFPSYAEGFGLPIVEAARRGRPVICSDIPVFREVGGAGALYFRVNDARALAETIADFLDGRRAADPDQILRVAWRDAARRIVEVVAREDWSRRLH
ncbi:glycosyltransferase family 4 protein [Methylocystis sp. H4A]|uniref:glycosyltransferase family 4 protein n=1 Tax=Methylocystis sp. H4A TaxID=2785788 RepID=UPI0018C1EDF9|nr:glycosyltransferase family 1 protein [Methylocystis sp. H4A]MBG0800375.1 glycosyltransferase family 4 protein [Methylocystis sp. H4A]